MKKLLALLLALVMVFALVACGGDDDVAADPTPGASTEPGGNDIDDIVGGDDDVVDTKDLYVIPELSVDSQGNLHPFAVRTSGVELYAIYEQLYTTENGIGSDLVPWLADANRGGNNELGLKGMDHEVGSGVYTFYIYDYIKDSKGNPIKAEDVVFSFEKTLAYGQASGWGAIEKWEAVDDTTINMVCSRDMSTKGELNNILLRCFMVSKKSFEESPSEFTSDAVGSGRYAVTDYVQDVSVTLEKRDDYWQTNEDLIPRSNQANVQKITTYAINDNNTKVVALQSGQLDLISSMPVASVGDLANDAKYEVYTYAQNGIHYLEPNCSEDSIMSDINMRLAVYYAISNENLAKVLNAAGGTAVESYYPLTAFGHDLFGDYPASWDNQDNYVTQFGIEKSKEYQQKAGYNGEELKLLNANDTSGLVENVINMLTAAGLNVKNSPYDRNGAQAQYADSKAWDLYYNTTNSSDYVTNLFDHSWNNGGEGATKNFILDEKLNDLMKKAYNVTATTEDVEALWAYTVEMAYTYPMVRNMNAMILPANTISNVWLGDKNNFFPGAAHYIEP